MSALHTFDDGGLAAGILVLTDEGLVPIEQIQIDDRVLSQPEAKGELAFRQVVKTFCFEEKALFAVVVWEYRSPVPECRLDKTYDGVGCLVVTGNHPFWVKGVGWTSADCLNYGDVLEMSDGQKAKVYEAGPLYRIRERQGGFLNARDPVGYGSMISFHNGKWLFGEGFYLSREESEACDIDPFTQTVYNLEVEDFHTYYVAQAHEDLGIWVHNTNCAERTWRGSGNPAKTGANPSFQGALRDEAAQRP